MPSFFMGSGKRVKREAQKCMETMGKPKFPCEKIFMGEKFTYDKNFLFLCVFVFVAAFFSVAFSHSLEDGDDKIQIYSIVWYITSIKLSMLPDMFYM